MAYMQFRILEGDQQKTSFRVPCSQYEFRVGVFGLYCMSLVLMQYMHSIFCSPVLSFDLTGWVRSGVAYPAPPMLGRFVEVYCDDILIFSETREEHLVHVCLVLEILLHHKIYAAKASKCQFSSSSVGFLGHVISEQGVAVDPRKVAEWATQLSCTDLCRFVGLTNYYSKLASLPLSGTDCPVQPSRQVRVWRRAADELRLAEGSHVGAGASCVGS